MNRQHLTGFLVLLTILMVFAGCRKEKSGELPDMRILLKPETGTTTDIFEISADLVGDEKLGTDIFYRWDWNNDGIWDTQFSSGNLLSHRFRSAGNQVVTLEYSDGKKQVKTEILTITVQQGYSAPKPVFEVSPTKGNYLTTFVFDASQTYDDEDSLNQLQFKWDFEGDGRWNTLLSKSPVAENLFKTAGVYHPVLFAVDPSGRSATYTTGLIVNLEDSLIVADFSINGDLIRVNDTLLLDASASYHSKYPFHVLKYSWLLPNRVEYTDPETVKTRVLIPGQSGPISITLKVIDVETGLYNMITREIYVANENLPPVSKIRAGCRYGNILTQFYFDSWASTDDEQAPSELDVRWDFNGDGIWDTPFSKEKIVFHQFEQPGEFYMIMEARDGEGLSSKGRYHVYVSANTNQTGYFRDKRDGQFYGTVKLGNQWWMSQNLNFIIPPKESVKLYPWLCLNGQSPQEQSQWCDQVGKMYRISAVVENRTDDDLAIICPEGWRLPAKEDWETLFATVGGEQNARELRYGGKSDFNALDLGYASYSFVYQGAAVVDTIFEYEDTFRKACFFSSTLPYDPNHARADIWQWRITKDGEEWVGYESLKLYMPVRCVKVD